MLDGREACFLVIVYDIGITLTGSLVGLTRPAYLLVEKTGRGRTADEAGRAQQSVVTVYVFLYHNIPWCKLFCFSLHIFLNENNLFPSLFTPSFLSISTLSQSK